MSRLTNDPLVELIRGLRQDLDQLKTAQFTGGDSLFGNLVYSGNLNDWSSGPIAGYGTKNKYILTFTPAFSSTPPVTQLFFFYSINQPNVLANYIPPWANGPTIVLTMQPLPPSGKNIQWAFSLMNNDPTGTAYTAYVYCIFSGTDSGTWSIAAY